MRPAASRRGLGIAGIAVAVLLAPAATASAQTGGYTGSIYFVSVDTAEGERSDAFYLLNGFDVERGILRASVTLPFIVQRAAYAVPEGTPLDVPWASGLGDPFFRVDVAAWRSPERDASLRLSAAIKAPIASVDDGFSSGEVDYAVGVSWSAFRGRQSVLADVTYWVLGDPAGTDYRNIASFYVGYGRVLDSRYRWSAIVSASGSPAVIPGLDPSAQWSVAVLRVLGPRASFGVSLDLGLTDSAADFALGGTWRIAF